MHGKCSNIQDRGKAREKAKTYCKKPGKKHWHEKLTRQVTFPMMPSVVTNHSM